MEPIRINKFLSEIGYCSRREADKLIEQGRVKINGAVPEMGTKVTHLDRISVDGTEVNSREKAHVYLALNKPVGIVCTTDAGVEKDNIIDFINYPERIFPIGRLDKASEGLILLTSDGDIVNKILRASNGHEKEYQVWVNKPIDARFIDRMSKGVPILGTVTRPCVIKPMGAMGFTIVLTQGLNRQIRRMCEHLGYRVTRLKRVRIMNISLDTELGAWRHLTQKELERLTQSVQTSNKTAEFTRPRSS
jgi:23S rRNA pseudouridine2604 synthase